MPIFIVVAQHSPESCPIHNEKTRKTTLEILPKLDEAAKKHGVKTIGSYVVMPEHKFYTISDAPTADDFRKVVSEPPVLQWIGLNTIEIKLAMPSDEAVKMLPK